MGKYDSEKVIALIQSGAKLEAPWRNAPKEELENVNCGSCHACCHQVAILTDEDLENPNIEYQVQPINSWNEDRTALTAYYRLQHNPDGSCIYLTDQGCGIYENRPLACRTFHCGKLYDFLDPDYISDMVKMGDDYDRQMIDSGKLRSAKSKIKSK